jgi:hypothetical protein
MRGMGAAVGQGDTEALNNLNTLDVSFSGQGEGFTLDKDQVRYDAKGNFIAGKKNGTSEIDSDFLKEERKAATVSTTALRKRASVIESSIGKISSLVPEIKGGSRAAAGAAVMSLARLVSPGVVTEGDFRAMSGAADPIATIMGRLTDKGDSGKPLMEALQAAYDPTNPDLIDADALLRIANSIVSSEAPAILQEYKESDSRARRSGMNQRQYGTIFGDSTSITGLSKYMPANAGKFIIEEVNE